MHRMAKSVQPSLPGAGPTPAFGVRSGGPDKLQLLGLAFASADLAFEVDDDGIIAFAMGAAKQILGVEAHALAGWDWRAFVDLADVGVLGLILKDLGSGERRGGIRVNCVSTADGHRSTPVELSVFRLPARAGRISCAFRLRDASTTNDRRTPTGLLDRDSFEALTRDALQNAVQSGSPLHLDLVELPGFAASRAGLSEIEDIKARREVTDALRAGAHGGFVAAELTLDRYALMRSTEAGELLDRLESLTGSAVTCATQSLSLEAKPAHSLRAIRFALDRHIEAGPVAAGEAFQSVLAETLRGAEAFRKALTAGNLGLVFQPVVDLRTRKLHHFEALTRFEEDSSPQEAIRLTEELDIIAELDLAVFGGVADLLRANEDVQIAVNISARSLVEPGFTKTLSDLTKGDLGLCRRLLVEVTETHALKDLEAANLAIGQLQYAGHTVCLDDFGAGAASLDYLSCLRVDIVKIDGRYIRSLRVEMRDRFIVQHVVNLCRDLGIAVIAEMVEDEETAKIATKLGAALGQGWLFGKPSGSLIWPVENHETPIQAALASQ